MIDIEHVTTGIFEMLQRNTWKDIDNERHRFQPVLNDALKLLKEQEAVEPNVTSAEQRCGNCNKVIEMDGWKSCPWCGKPIAWSEWWNKNGERSVK